MIRIFRAIFTNYNPPSLIWIHDGFYLHSSIPQLNVEGLIQSVLAQFGYGSIVVKVSLLLDSLARVIPEYPHLVCVGSHDVLTSEESYVLQHLQNPKCQFLYPKDTYLGAPLAKGPWRS